MASVKINKTAPTPSEEIIAEANRVVYVTDARGRVIGIKKMSMSVRRRALKALSNEMAQKEQYLGLVMVAASVAEIDGDPIVLPTTELQFDALIDRLDDDGFAAVARGIRENFAAGQSLDEVAAEAGE